MSSASSFSLSASLTYPMSLNSKMTNQSRSSGVNRPSSLPSVGFCMASSSLRVPSVPVNRVPSGTVISAKLPTFAFLPGKVHDMLFRNSLSPPSSAFPWASSAAGSAWGFEFFAAWAACVDRNKVDRTRRLSLFVMVLSVWNGPPS